MGKKFVLKLVMQKPLWNQWVQKFTFSTSTNKLHVKMHDYSKVLDLSIIQMLLMKPEYYNLNNVILGNCMKRPKIINVIKCFLHTSIIYTRIWPLKLNIHAIKFAVCVAVCSIFKNRRKFNVTEIRKYAQRWWLKLHIKCIQND